MIGDRIESDEYGPHCIMNIYFDTEGHDLIRRSMEKPIYKEKLRLRSYGVPEDDDFVYLEIKKKFRGIVYKRRIKIRYCDAMNYIKSRRIPEDCDSQVMREIDYMISYYDLKPAVFLAYNRIGYRVKDMSEIRFTIDTDIRSRLDKLDLKNGDNGEMLFDEKLYLMEIKSTSGLPIWFVKALNEMEIYRNSFSKYAKIYEKRFGKIINNL